LKNCVSVAALSEQIGDAAAARLRMHIGGREVHIPKRKRGRMYAEIIAAIGQESADELLRIYAGESLYIATNARELQTRHRASIAELRAQGKTWAQIAREYSFKTTFTERWVRKLGAQDSQRPGPQQVNLFDHIPVPHPLDALSRQHGSHSP